MAYNFLPSRDSLESIGSTVKAWLKGYFYDLVVNNLTASNLVATDSNKKLVSKSALTGSGDITAINNIPVGQTTRAAGAFTTLNFENSGAAVNTDYGAAHADATITLAQWASSQYFTATNADTSAANLIVPAKTKFFLFKNTSTSAVTVKVSGQTGVAVANNKYALLFNNGTDVVRVTADT